MTAFQRALDEIDAAVSRAQPWADELASRVPVDGWKWRMDTDDRLRGRPVGATQREIYPATAARRFGAALSADDLRKMKACNRRYPLAGESHKWCSAAEHIALREALIRRLISTAGGGE